MRRVACVLALVLVACGGSSDPAGTDVIPGEVTEDHASPDVVTDLPADRIEERLEADLAATDPGPTDLGLEDTGATDPAALDPGVVDPGTLDPGPIDPGSTDPDITDPDATDVPALGTKAAGERCTDAAECSMGMSCIQGQYTPAHCNIQCGSTTECQAISPDTNVVCQAIGATGVCLWRCGPGVGTCPSGLVCTGIFCG